MLVNIPIQKVHRVSKNAFIKGKSLNHNSQTTTRKASSIASIAAIAGLAHSNIIDRSESSEGSKSEPVSEQTVQTADKDTAAPQEQKQVDLGAIAEK